MPALVAVDAPTYAGRPATRSTTALLRLAVAGAPARRPPARSAARGLPRRARGACRWLAPGVSVRSQPLRPPPRRSCSPGRSWNGPSLGRLRRPGAPGARSRAPARQPRQDRGRRRGRARGAHARVRDLAPPCAGARVGRASRRACRAGAVRPARLPDAPRTGRVHRLRAGAGGSPRDRGPQADDRRGGGRRRRRVPGDAPRGRLRFPPRDARARQRPLGVRRAPLGPTRSRRARCRCSRRSSSRRRPPLRPEASPREGRTSTGVAGTRSRVAEAGATFASCGTRTTPASRFPHGRRSSSGCARRSAPSTGARRRSTRSSPIAGSRTSTRWTPAPPTAGCRPIRSSPTATASRAAGCTSR